MPIVLPGGKPSTVLLVLEGEQEAEDGDRVAA